MPWQSSKEYVSFLNLALYSLFLDLNLLQYLLGRESYSTILHVISLLESLANQDPDSISD